MKKISLVLIIFLFLISSCVININATDINTQKNLTGEKREKTEINSVWVGNVSILLFTEEGEDYYEWESWFKTREFALHFGFEKLQIVLPYTINAENLDSNSHFEVFAELDVNGNYSNKTEVIPNFTIIKDSVKINVNREKLIIIKYFAQLKLFKDSECIDSDSCKGTIIILSIKQFDNSNFPVYSIYKMLSRFLMNQPNFSFKIL